MTIKNEKFEIQIINSESFEPINNTMISTIPNIRI